MPVLLMNSVQRAYDMRRRSVKVVKRSLVIAACAIGIMGHLNSATPLAGQSK